MKGNRMEKQVIILHPCNYTRRGIGALLYPAYQVFDTNDLTQCKRWLSSGRSTDLLIISLQGEYYTMVDTLSLIEALCNGYSSCQLLVMLDTKKNPGLENYLSQYGNKVQVIKPDSLLPVFIQMVHQDESSVQQDITGLDKGHLGSLSVLELKILELLLTGKKACKVAYQMSLNEKAFSYYKQQLTVRSCCRVSFSFYTAFFSYLGWRKRYIDYTWY